MVNYVEDRRRLQPHEFLFTLGVLGVKFLSQLFFKNLDISTFRGISIGVRDMEVGIKIGSGVGVIGNVIYNFQDKTLRMESPELILNERLSYLADLSQSI